MPGLLKTIEVYNEDAVKCIINEDDFDETKHALADEIEDKVAKQAKAKEAAEDKAAKKAEADEKAKAKKAIADKAKETAKK